MDRYRTTNRATLFPELDEQQQRPSQASDRMVVGGLTYRGSGFPSGALPPSLPRPPVEMEMRKLRAVATQRPSSIPPTTAAAQRHLTFVRLVGNVSVTVGDSIPFERLRQCALFSPAVHKRRALTRLSTAHALKPWSTIPTDVTIKFPDSKHIETHQVLLASHSKSFMKLIETTKNITKMLVNTSVSFNEFKYIIDGIYNGCYESNADIDSGCLPAHTCHTYSEIVAYDKMYALGRDYDMRAVHEHACRQLIHTLDASNVLNAIATAEIYRDPVLLCACACWLSAHFDALPSALITRWGANSEHRRLISTAHRIGNALAAGL